jgi:energy-converting hydrogenase Eha subunit E
VLLTDANTIEVAASAAAVSPAKSDPIKHLNIMLLVLLSHPEIIDQNYQGLLSK